MSFGSDAPKAPKAQAPPPTIIDAEPEGRAERWKQKQKKGRKSTILTGSQGVPDQKTVLG